MACRTPGLNPRAVWTDEERLFSVHWLESGNALPRPRVSASAGGGW